MQKKDQNRAEILGVGLNSSSYEGVLTRLTKAVEKSQKLFVVTPNPEFLVYSQQNSWFKDVLNQADLSIPDGIGLVWAAWFLRIRPKLTGRVAGADLVADLLATADRKNWRVGLVGVRGEDQRQAEQLLKRLQARYLGARFQLLGKTPDWPQRKWHLVLACHGMGGQEKWIKSNISRTKSGVFMGAGGALDFLTKFSHRAPRGLQKLGLEWFWRLLLRPAHHWRRVWRACVVFPWLVLQEKLRSV